MEDITEKNIKKIRKDLDNAIELFVGLTTMQKKVDDITKVAEYIVTSGREFDDIVKFNKAITEFHKRIQPILRKIED